MKKIVFMLIAPMLVLFAFGPLKTFTVSGLVLDGKGNGIYNAYVLEKNTSNSAQTDANGKFTIDVRSSKSKLIISAEGYNSKEISLDGRSEVRISLNSELKVDSTIVDYKLEKKIDANSQIRVRGISSFPSPSNELQGKAAGVVVNGYDVKYQTPKQQRNPANQFNTEEYDNINENPFLKVTDNPLSTFSIDVDAASYSNVRRFLNDGQLPPAGAVRIEEMINYFHYDYPQPDSDDPFSVNTEFSDCPWNNDHKLVLVGLQGRKISTENLPPSNLVFLIDVSGSMMDENKLPLVKASMKMLVDQLREKDKVALVVYAGNAGLVLSPTSGADKMKIKDAIDNLEAGGSTAGGEGIKLAYKTAKENFVSEGNNRIILCTDGDFNVGASSDDELVRMIEEERKSGVFLTVLGFGMGNYKDSKMEELADKGNGNHAYIDGMNEAKKVLINEFGGTLFTIAQDVKLQIEFNPSKVQGYRLIGYENRLLNKEDFNDDKKDAGELGSGHTVTALYEIIPVGVKDSFLRKVDDLKYQKNKSNLASASTGDEVMNIKLRYKQPRGSMSKLIEHAVPDAEKRLSSTSNNFRFAAAVAEFGMLLRQSDYKSKSNFTSVINLAQSATGDDKEGYRAEFIRLAGNARSLANGKNVSRDDDENMGNTNR